MNKHSLLDKIASGVGRKHDEENYWLNQLLEILKCVVSIMILKKPMPKG